MKLPIDKKERITLGGVKQAIHIWGTKAENPVILFLHGGPGVPNRHGMAVSHMDLTDDFTIVAWDQRGTGGSYFGCAPESLTLDQLISDCKDLIDYLCRTLGKEKIFLLGGSWGTELGTFVCQRHPEKIAGYIGYGQVVNGIENEAVSYAYVLNKAKEAGNAEDIAELEKEWLAAIDYLREFHLVDSEHEINGLLREGKSVLCEGAQGTLLDVDFGSYPFVTSSNTICAGACTGLGIGPNKIGNVYGIMKAYCTRVGSGPFPTELFDETGKTIRDLGHEYGAVTGRERRCGWIDLVALKYAIMVNGVTHLIMMKSDVLDGFDTIKACVAYNVNGEEVDYFPYDITEGVEPIYVELPGWKTDMTKMTSEDEFPEEFNAYVTFLEEQLETPIKIISVGPDRAQTIERYTEE